MKLKELDRNGNVAWSPKSCNKSYLAVGTSSQQLDSSFSTTSQLEIFEYIPNQKNWDMPISASVSSESKFSKLLWGNADHNDGFIVGGTENGSISVYDASLLLKNGKCFDDNSSRIVSMKGHKGAINAMDFNKFKPNLLATGSVDSDIFIWDLDKLDEPMNPGNKTQPAEEILSLSWNHKVQHILASTSAHRCQILDLRKSDPVIKLSDSQMKMKCKKVVWHPDISTRLCISSEDDHTPIIQLWDLRYIQCPFHTFHKHTKGIVDLDWCLDDSDILMSVGKDRQMICWNMSTHNLSTSSDSTSEVIYEWQLDQEWINEARFCPKHPGLVSISSSDCHIGIYSLLGGRDHIPRELSDTVNDSFPLDLCNEDGSESEIVKKEAEKAAELQFAPTPSLLKAPKWLKRPIGARFSFGGKLVQFYKAEASRSRNNSESQNASTSPNECQYKVIISQVITDKNLVLGSNMLVKATEAPDTLLNYCQDKVDSITNRLVDTEHGSVKSELMLDRNVWKFIECHFQEDSRLAFMHNLGYSESNLKSMEKISQHAKQTNHNLLHENEGEDFDCERFEVGSRGRPLVQDSFALLLKGTESERSLSVALMTGNIDLAIDICLAENRSGEAAILAVSSGRQELYDKVQSIILTNAAKTHSTTHLIAVAVARNWQDLVEKCDLKDWREALAWLLTYVSVEELGDLCGTLGRRLEQRSDQEMEYLFASCVCYICSGSVENFVRSWMNSKSVRRNTELQRLVEMIILLCKSIGDEDFSLVRGEAAHVLKRYASLLVSQGDLATALTYLGDNDDHSILALRYRICQHLADQLPSGIKKPDMPFKMSPICNSWSRLSSAAVPQKQPFHKPFGGESGGHHHAAKVMDAPPPTNDYGMRSPELTNNAKTNPASAYGEVSTHKLANNVPQAPPKSNNMSSNLYQPQPSRSFVPQSAKQPPVYARSEVAPQLANATSLQTGQAQSKPSWNDPPLLSENYRADEDKSESSVQQQFYNPVNFIPESADVSVFANRGAMVGPGPTQSSHGAPSFPSTTQGPAGAKTRPVEKVCSLSVDKQHWKSSLYGLLEYCREADGSRQTKVKMEEIQKKLDHLFDLLQSQSVSVELVSGLEALMLLVDSKNYRESLNKVNQIIQTVNFSEAGSFLPSLKMLIQCVIKVSG